MSTIVRTAVASVGMVALAGALAAGCGGRGGGAPRPVEDPSDDSGPGPDTSSVLIPEEKFDEVKRVFESKTPLVSRCYVAGVEAAEVDKAAKVTITVGVTVTTSGAASNVRILSTSASSPAVESCITDLVAGWTFTDSLPKPLETSHTYVLDRF